MAFEQLPPLSDEHREGVRAECTNYFFNRGISNSLAKPDWREGIAAIDDWIVANMASVDAALPELLRNELTMQQKAYMFFAVVKAKLGDF